MKNKLKKKKYKKAIIIEHFPKAFSSLRLLDELTDKEISESFDPVLNKESLKSIKESDGKSGSFFFTTYDKKFIVKTISETEVKKLTSPEFLRSFTTFLKLNGENSLINRIYGVYTILLSSNSSISIILMPNLVFIPHRLIYRIFDLKGSRIDRITPDINKSSKNKLKALKDLDYLWINDTVGIADFSGDSIEHILTTLEDDLSFLREQRLMDYSLLVIIAEFPKKNDELYDEVISLFGNPKFYKKIFKSRTSKYIYCLGLIDYLQEFNLTKFLENKYKKLLYWSEVKYISAVDPMNYAQRMKDFLK